MAKLSKREKVLIYIMVTLLLVVGLVMLAIRPTLDAIDAADEVIGEQQVRQANMAQALTLVDGVKQTLDEDRARIRELEGRFLQPMSNDQLDTYLTGILTGQGLTAEALSIEMKDLNEEAQAQDAEKSEALAVRQVRVVASGTMDDFVRLADQVQGLYGVRICDYNLQPRGGGNTLGAAEQTGQMTMNIGFEILMLDQALLPEGEVNP
ncbi:type II secretion system protein M [Christensenellaceae bacterium NSJ-44]|uniref:Type II secretion system protein M n=1 Tax=Luoshenia tenuis TaxID=2763654 RepID=A0A926D0H1_9FIRM|nr:hypothetical protein [Luoshenia tenuis]MBC8530110.1 type II secretion system protein M [Luoshenia tenuis]